MGAWRTKRSKRAGDEEGLQLVCGEQFQEIATADVVEKALKREESQPKG
jgi:hypothetical protein